MQSVKETVLLYNIQPAARQDQILDLFDRLYLPYRVITKADADQTLGYLLGKSDFLEASSTDTASAPQGEMLVSSGLSDLRLNMVLKALRTSGIAPVALKAVVTETNIHWPLKKLYANLLMEHMQMRKLQQQGPSQV